MISHKHRFIYLEIPKCGTRTLKRFFFKQAGGGGVFIPIWLEERGCSLIALYPDYFVFAFVRNPFDRFLSFFLNGSRLVRAVRKERFLHHDILLGRQSDIDIKDCLILPSPYKSLEECAEQKQQGLWDLKEDQYIGQNKFSYPQLHYERWHSQSQARFLLDIYPPVNRERSCLEGTPCSFIGRLEHFDQDLISLLSIFGLSHLPLKKRNVSYKRKDADGKRKHYSAYYTKRARALVEEIYARDLELLGYEFEDETKTSVLIPLYDMDQLQEKRKKAILARRWMGFKFYLLRFYLAIHSILYKGIQASLHFVKRVHMLNYLYEKLYKPLKGRMIG